MFQCLKIAGCLSQSLRCSENSQWRYFVACIFFIAGCVLATLSWKNDTPVIFVILFIVLGTTGFFISCLNAFKVTSDKEGEMLPLLSPSDFKVSMHRWKKSCGENSDHLLNSDVKTSQTPQNICNVHSTKKDVNHNNQSVHKLKNQEGSNDVNENVITCDVNSYCPRLDREEYATGPSPGVGQSRKTAERDKTKSRQSKISQIMPVFKAALPTEPTAQFHISLDTSSCQESIESLVGHPSESKYNSTRNIQAESLEARYISSNPNEPIYQNVIPYPLNKRAISESDMIQLLDYDIPSKELTPYTSERCKTSPYSDQKKLDSIPVLADIHRVETSKRTSRLGPFTRPERKWNKTQEMQENTDMSMYFGHLKYTRNFQKDEDNKCSNLNLDHMTMSSHENIYENISYKDKNLEQTKLSTPDTHLQKTSRIKGNVENTESMVEQFCPLRNENIYMNVPSIRKTINQTVERNLDYDRSTTEKGLNRSSGTTRLLKPDSIYMNLPASVSHVKSSTCTSKLIREEQSSECSINTENFAKKIHSAQMEKSDTNKIRSENMYGTILQTPNESNKSMSQNVVPESPHFSSMPNAANLTASKSEDVSSDYIYVTGLGPIFKTYIKPGASVIRNIPLSTDYNLLERSEAVDNSSNSTCSSRTEPERLSTTSDYIGIQQRGNYALDSNIQLQNRHARSFKPEMLSSGKHIREQNAEDQISEARSHKPEITPSTSVQNQYSRPRHAYENALYDVNISASGNQCMKGERQKDIPIKEKCPSFSNKCYLNPAKISDQREETQISTTTQNNVSLFNETFTVDTNICRSRLDTSYTKSTNVRSLLELSKSKASSSKRVDNIPISKDQSFLSQSKNNLELCSKHSLNSETEAQQSTDSESLTARKQSDRFWLRTPSTTAEGKKEAKHIHSVVKYQIYPKEETNFSSLPNLTDIRREMAPHAIGISPNRLQPTGLLLEPPKKVAIPGIFNRSSTVQTHPQKCSLTNKGIVQPIKGSIQSPIKQTKGFLVEDPYLVPKAKFGTFCVTSGLRIDCPDNFKLLSKASTDISSMKTDKYSSQKPATSYSLSPISGTRKECQKLPCPDTAYFVPPVSSSLGKSSKVDIPVILNRSPNVQIQLQKFSVLNRSSSVQSIKCSEPSTKSQEDTLKRCSSVVLKTKAEKGPSASNTGLSDKSLEKDNPLHKSSPIEDPSIKYGHSSDISYKLPNTSMISKLQLNIPSSDDVQADESTDEDSIISTHSPVFF